MTVDESGDVSMLSGEVQKWFMLHAELPVETLMDPALLIANTHILFNPKRGDIKVMGLTWLDLSTEPHGLLPHLTVQCCSVFIAITLIQQTCMKDVQECIGPVDGRHWCT